MTLDEIRRLVLAGQLMSEDAIDEQLTNWNESADNADDGTKFVESLVEEGVITGFHGKALQAGVSGPYKFGPYVVKDRLIVGSLGNVYRAIHDEFNQHVGLKIFSGKINDDPERAVRLARETRVAVQVDHPNVVRTFQVGRMGDVVFLAIEDLQGETLAAKLEREGKLSEHEVLKLGRQIALGLAHLHSLEIIHRDIRPANIWVTADGHAKLMEFGGARDALSELDEIEADSFEEVRKKAIHGNYDYLSAEQGLDEDLADERSDVYALGCILFRCLTGEVVFPEENPVRKMLKHALEPAALASEFDETVPRESADVVATMLSKAPEDRYQEAKDVAWALEQLIDEEDDLAAATADIDPDFLKWAKESHLGESETGGPAAVAEPVLLDFLDWMSEQEEDEE